MVGGLTILTQATTITSKPLQQGTFMSTRRRADGDVTIEARIEKRGELYRYIYRWIDSSVVPVPESFVELSATAEALAHEAFGQIAQSVQGGATSTIAGRKLRAVGMRLWEQLLPRDLRDDFGDATRKPARLLVVSDVHALPWELLHPEATPADGFLVERVALSRWPYGASLPSTLDIQAAHLVAPAGSPPSAEARGSSTGGATNPGPESKPPGGACSGRKR